MSQGAFYVPDILQPAKKSNSSQIAVKLKKKKKKRAKRELASSSDLGYPANHVLP